MSASRLVLGMVAAMCLGLCSAAQAETAVTDEVVKLLKASVGEDVILSFIRDKGAPAELDADRIIELKKAGATSAVLMALMKGSGAEFPFDLDGEHTVDKPGTHGAISVYPICRRGPVSVETYLTLDEATGAKIIKISEKGDGSVPVVVISNSGALPLYISAGEVIYGGKQDRMIAYDVIVEPGRDLTVEVRCVEQGRWSGRSQTFASAKAMGNKRTRAAVQFKNQGEVWREVAAQNRKLRASSGTGSYKASLSKSEVSESYSALASRVLPGLSGRHVVGMVVAVNGKVEAIEIFGAPGLFAKLKEKLLKSYVLDAQGVKDEKRTAPGKGEILDFYRKTMAAQAKELKKYGKNTNAARRAPHADANENFDSDGRLLRRSMLAN